MFFMNFLIEKLKKDFCKKFFYLLFFEFFWVNALHEIFIILTDVLFTQVLQKYI